MLLYVITNMEFHTIEYSFDDCAIIKCELMAKHII